MAATTQGGMCPVCWARVRRGAHTCASCQADLDVLAVVPPAATGASAAAERPAPGAGGDLRPRWRFGPWVTVVVGLTALLTAAAIKVVSGLLPPPAEYGAATGNVGRLVAVTPQTARRALMNFYPAGDVETVGVAIAYATRDKGTLPGALTRVQVRPGPQGSQYVTVSVPVNIPFLLKVRAIETRLTPNVSNVQKGRLYVQSADDNAYGIVMNPKTDVAVFAFRVSADDRNIWPVNLNALQVISQTQQLG